ncbi:hypothetical protein FIV00_15170 [Labrenzia sp. THAF82]|uniref:hypothetical protein n=1 Tax=Labrenzia sp. THAF82 TaxID=2587861 RepID=UPI0012697C9D|nr:hypothetical protein [Labrenzia sp. THAF82]QFT31832.1 hypothetical protein FIV00_15170 [Labrenzia sp. THAF82]
MRWLSDEAEKTYLSMQENLEADLRRHLKSDDQSATAAAHRASKAVQAEARAIRDAHIKAMADFAARYSIPDPIKVCDS